MRAIARISNSHPLTVFPLRQTPLKPRKKPAQSRSAETVGVLVEAAARVLEERGLAGYTTNAVAERAGVSVGSLYQYFPGKDALTAALIERETAILLSDVGAAATVPDAREGLRLLVAAAVGHQMRRPSLARLLDFEERRLPLGEEVAAVSRTVTAGISALIARLPDASLVDRDEAAADILAMVKGMVDAAGERGETASQRLDARVRRAVFGYLGLDDAGAVRASKTREPR